jgi:hypothetical protein
MDERRRRLCRHAALLTVLSALTLGRAAGALPTQGSQSTEPSSTTDPCTRLRFCDSDAGNGQVTVEVGVPTGGLPGGGEVVETGGGGGSAEDDEPEWWVWHATPLTPAEAAAAGPCVGTWYLFEYTHAREGWVSTNFNRCVPPGEEPTLPTLPSVETFMDIADIPAPDISVNPTEGITGLESWFWVDGFETHVEAVVDVDGWRVAAALDAIEWRWTVEGETYTSSGPGSEADPAAQHTFDVKGSHEVVVEVEWAGSFDVTGYGVSFTQEVLDAQTSSSADYTVVEVVTVVDEPD